MQASIFCFFALDDIPVIVLNPGNKTFDRGCAPPRVHARVSGSKKGKLVLLNERSKGKHSREGRAVGPSEVQLGDRRVSRTGTRTEHKERTGGGWGSAPSTHFSPL